MRTDNVKSGKVGAVVSYCTNDFRFLGKLLEELKVCVDEIVVPVCDHFFDGTPEDRRLLSWTYALYPNVTFIEIPYDPHQISGFTPDHPDWARAWHSFVRAVGFMHLKTPQVLFIDADEIPEGALLKPRLQTELAARRFRTYLYDLTPNRRSNAIQALPLLVSRAAVIPSSLFSLQERSGIYDAILGPKELDDVPVVHHYSWCRTEQEARRKMHSWGHRNDLNWEAIIPPAYRAGTLKATLGQSLEYETVVPYFDPLAVVIPEGDPYT